MRGLWGTWVPLFYHYIVTMALVSERPINLENVRGLYNYRGGECEIILFIYLNWIYNIHVCWEQTDAHKKANASAPARHARQASEFASISNLTLFKCPIGSWINFFEVLFWSEISLVETVNTTLPREFR